MKKFIKGFLVATMLLTVAGATAVVLNKKGIITLPPIGPDSSEVSSSSDSSSDDITSELEAHPFPTSVYTLASLGGTTEAWSVNYHFVFNQENKPSNVSASAYGAWTATFSSVLTVDSVVDSQDLSLTTNSGRYASTTGPLKVGWSSSAPLMDVPSMANDFTYYSYLIIEAAFSGSQSYRVATDPTGTALIYARTPESDWFIYDSATADNYGFSSTLQFALVYGSNSLSSSITIGSLDINLAREE